jgi:DNA-binding XRE family transcriptional regulator
MSERQRAGVNEALYNRIAMLRVERGISRRQLADALGVHYQTVGYLERGEFAPSLHLALRLAQFFPVYWLGLGMRSALLPDALASVEIGQSWRQLETLGVLGAWAVAGLVLAPIILRRMARRESGSSVEARRQRALQRVS